MTDTNYDLIPTTKESTNAMGGTELMLRRIYGGDVPRALLEKVQIHPSRVGEQQEGKPQILYLHDLPNDPAVARIGEPWWQDKFAAIVMVSNWQMDHFNMVKGLPYGRCLVINNAITPIDVTPEDKIDPDGKIKMIYHTTPHRGLNILIPVFIELAKEHPNLELDVYSSFKIYGWHDRDKEFEGLFQICRDHPQINYHGAVENEVIRDALKKAHIFPFPSIWPETSCLALMEAMSAGVLCVHPNLAALPETSMGLTKMYQFHEDHQRHANQLHNYLRAILQSREWEADYLHTFVKAVADARFDWDRRHREWTALLNALTQTQIDAAAASAHEPTEAKAADTTDALPSPEPESDGSAQSPSNPSEG